MATILDDYLDAEFDHIAPVSLNKYEADLFMTAGRAAQITKLVGSALKSGIRRGKYERWRLVTDGLYREQVLDNLVGAAVRRIYNEVMSAKGDIDNPKPSRGLVKELARAYRKKARGLTSIFTTVLRGLGAIFEDEGDYMRNVPSPAARRQRALELALELWNRHGRVRGRAAPREAEVIEAGLEKIDELLRGIGGRDGLSAQNEQFKNFIAAVKTRAGLP